MSEKTTSVDLPSNDTIKLKRFQGFDYDLVSFVKIKMNFFSINVFEFPSLFKLIINPLNHFFRPNYVRFGTVWDSSIMRSTYIARDRVSRPIVIGSAFNFHHTVFHDDEKHLHVTECFVMTVFSCHNRTKHAFDIKLESKGSRKYPKVSRVSDYV